MVEENIMGIMNTISYGFLDEENNIIESNSKKWEEHFSDFYYLLSPSELLEKKYGTCWDQVELERFLFEQESIKVKTFFICTYMDDGAPCHTFLTYEKNNHFYWFEHSWGKYRGIHEYVSLTELLLDVKKKFVEYKEFPTIVYEYTKPPFHLTCDEFYEYASKGSIIHLNEPLYFYHIMNKDVKEELGILSLQYMYDHQLFELFDKNACKYKTRIIDNWNIPKYQGREEDSLTREEILDALNIFRGPYGSKYIYFFRYPPYKKLGPKMKTLLETKNIYQIDINDEEIQKYILDISYGYQKSNTDNQKLDKKYYETVSKEEYFKDYDDSLTMNFSTLNHIGIAFIDSYCPFEILKKIS